MKNIIVFFSSLTFSMALLASVQKFEEKSFADLIKAAKNESLTMNERWQSLVKAAENASPGKIEIIKKFSTSNEWFMRNAALVSLEKVGLEEAISEAKILIHDKALVVRSAAVTTLSKKRTLEIKRLFANELTKAYNFSGRQSLWIRSQMMQQIAKLATSEDRQFLARYLFDSDKKVAAISASALEKITDIRFETGKQVQQWQSYVKEKKWL